MRKIFISGSISSKEIPKDVIKSVDDCRKRNYTILIGDAPGIDKNIQDMLKADNYKNVEVYHVVLVLGIFRIRNGLINVFL